MSLSAVKGSESESFENPEAGSYPARCIQVIELGTFPNDHPDAKPGAKKTMMKIVWELSEPMSDGRPFTVNQDYTVSLGKNSNLYKMLVAWRGRAFTAEELEGFNMQNILDKPCLISVVLKPSKKDPNKVYANVGGVLPLAKGMTVIERVNDLVFFEIENIRNQEEWDKVWPWVQKRILASDEGKVSGMQANEPKHEAAPANDPPLMGEEEIPF
jgi:hypothetical protein